jgi:hypothetical protein
MTRNIFRLRDLVLRRLIERRHDAEPVMNSRITDNSEQIDRKTSRLICDAIGERLQQSLRPDTSRLSSHLQHLIDELRRRDSEGRWRSSN